MPKTIIRKPVRAVISVTRLFQAPCIIITTTTAAASRGTSRLSLSLGLVSLPLAFPSSWLRPLVSHAAQKYIAFRVDRKRISKNPLKAVHTNRFPLTSEQPRSPNETIETRSRFKSPCTGGRPRSSSPRSILSSTSRTHHRWKPHSNLRVTIQAHSQLPRIPSLNSRSASSICRKLQLGSFRVSRLSNIFERMT